MSSTFSVQLNVFLSNKNETMWLFLQGFVRCFDGSSYNKEPSAKGKRRENACQTAQA